MTTEQAIALAESKFWESLSHRERAEFQLFEDKLCMPFDVFQEAVEQAIGRPAWTHEFCSAGVEHLRKELMGEAPPRTMQEILDLIPREKRVIVST